ncbi:hypothetical protein CK203_047691 [Vitis vinifera]|uniref:Cysteine-rich transmembrane domain-containing protein n=1 Tax=Vitis vinifera TaxID=29760 RepID=A0A438H225_VITVI|nr:hypothetical protein CK203_047691 [Vitis vinifera]
MSHSHQAPEVYPPPPSTAYPSSGPYVVPPPAGYPMKDAPNPQNPPPVETKSRGEGFWKGCCAALCCCCVLDACF